MKRRPSGRLFYLLSIRQFSLYSHGQITDYELLITFMQQTEKYWILINRIVLSGIVVMALLGVVLAFGPKVKQMRAYQTTRDTFQRQIDETVAAEKELKNKQQRFLADPTYVERVAHEVGYARKDETIYQFLDETEMQQGQSSLLNRTNP
jgi:hypothetical protein